MESERSKDVAEAEQEGAVDNDAYDHGDDLATVAPVESDRADG